MNYWEKRAVDAIGRMESAVNGALPELVQSFETARKGLTDAVYGFYGRYAADNTVSLAMAQQALSTTELKDFRGDLKEYESLAKNAIGTFNLQVSNLSTQARVSRLDALLTQCDAILQKLYQEQKAQVEGPAAKVYTEEYYRRLFDIEQITGAQFPFAQINTGAITKVLAQPVQGADISTRLWRQDIDTGFRIRQTLNQMFVTGKPPQAFAAPLAKIIGNVQTNPDGTPGGGGKKYEAYRLLYNEAAHVVNQAQLQAYQDDGIDEYENIATLDKATCDICAAQDGQHYPVDKAVEGENHPSFHLSCRCTTAPYIPDLHDLSTTRAARDPNTGKTVPTQAGTYGEWKTEQDAKFAEAQKEFDTIRQLGLNRAPDIDTFLTQRYNNSPEYRNLMQRLSNIQGIGDWKAVEFNPQTAERHFNDHGSAVGAKSVDEYTAAAVRFVNETPEKKLVVDTDGIKRFFLPETNEFASVYPDGTVSTYYKPRQGIKYWVRQVEKYGATEK